MLGGDYFLLILDMIGGGALAAALVIALWRRAARQAQHRSALSLKGSWARAGGRHRPQAKV